MNGRHVIGTGILLALFAVIGASLVALTHHATAARIAANERAALLRSLHTLISPDIHDNDIFTDTLEVRDPALLGSPEPLTVYRARKGGKPVAAVLTAIAPDGYSGNIKLLVAIRADGVLAGVRVVSHRETPGLGDAIDAERSDWILGFAGRSLADPGERGWAVKKDGGIFDQFTGATITPRAVVKAVHKALIYFNRNRQALFAPATATTEKQDD